MIGLVCLCLYDWSDRAGSRVCGSLVCTYAAMLFERGQRSMEAWYFMFSICFFNASRSIAATTLGSMASPEHTCTRAVPRAAVTHTHTHIGILVNSSVRSYTYTHRAHTHTHPFAWGMWACEYCCLYVWKTVVVVAERGIAITGKIKWRVLC